MRRDAGAGAPEPPGRRAAIGASRSDLNCELPGGRATRGSLVTVACLLLLSRLSAPPGPRGSDAKNWIAAARTALVSAGIDRVKVDVLARQLVVTRGSFYWHFRDRAELLEALLEALLDDWQATNNEPMLAAINASGARGERSDFDLHLGRLWAEEREYSPAYDSAVRDWARTDPAAKAAVHRVDATRIEALTEMFRAYGFEPDEAHIRGRITYYHQVGYYALKVQESTEERDHWGPLYDRVLLY